MTILLKLDIVFSLGCFSSSCDMCVCVAITAVATDLILDSYIICSFLSYIMLIISFSFFLQQIRNVFGAKNAKAHNNNNNKDSYSNTNNNIVNKTTGQCDIVAANLYVSQLKSFIAKNSNEPFDCRHRHAKQTKQQKPKQVAEQPSQQQQTRHLSTYLPNSSEPKSQYKDLKRKCKRAVYKFMKGLFDERKLHKFKNLSQDEPIYFEVSTSISMTHSTNRHLTNCWLNYRYINAGLSR